MASSCLRLCSSSARAWAGNSLTSILALCDSQFELALILLVDLCPCSNQLLHELLTIQAIACNARWGWRQLYEELVLCNSFIFGLQISDKVRLVTIVKLRGVFRHCLRKSFFKRALDSQ